MNKDELSRILAPIVGDRQVGREVVDLFFDTIADAVTRGEKVMITGMGTFERLQRRPRRGRNPGTGEPLLLRGDGIPKFHPSPIWKQMVQTGKISSVKPKPRGRAANLMAERAATKPKKKPAKKA